MLTIQERKGRKRKLGWPDHQKVDRKSADLERDRGPEYGHLRLDHTQAEPPDQGDDPQQPEPSNFEVEEFQRQEAKPLADFSVALIGFDRNHAVSQCCFGSCLISERCLNVVLATPCSPFCSLFSHKTSLSISLPAEGELGYD